WVQPDGRGLEPGPLDRPGRVGDDAGPAHGPKPVEGSCRVLGRPDPRRPPGRDAVQPAHPPGGPTAARGPGPGRRREPAAGRDLDAVQGPEVSLLPVAGQMDASPFP